MHLEQLSFDTEVSDERKVFNLIYPKLSDIVNNAPIDSGVLIFKELINCSSVYFLSTGVIVFQIRMRKTSRYLLLPESRKGDLPAGTPISKTKSDAGMIRISLSDPEDILLYTPVLRSILLDLTKGNQQFGCCGRYEACSDARTCIHPDIKFALGCQYRQNLINGRIFYGKNRNAK
jgi:hypothetical protein